MLEQLRLTQGSDRHSCTTISWLKIAPKLSHKAIMHRFDPERSDITLFLNLFERQVIRSGIETIDFVTHFLALLPVEVVELILRVSSDKIDNFDHV